MSEPLPPGWKWATVNEVSHVVLGQSPPGSSYNDVGHGSPFFQGKAEFGSFYPEVRKWTTDPKKQAAAGSVLVSVRAPVGPTNIAPFDCAIGRGLAALHPLGGIGTEYLLWAMRHTGNALTKQGTGSTFDAVTGAQLKTHRLPISPLTEQVRIVDAIEEHFSRIDAAESAAQTALAKLDTLRRTVLTAAFSGRLADPFNPRRTPDGLPEDWHLSTIGEVTEVLDSKRIPLNREERAKRPGNVPYYGATGQVGWIDEPIFNERLVLLGEDGAPFLDPLKDKAYIIDGPSWVNNHAHVLKADSNHISNDLLKHYLNYCPYNDYVTGTTRFKLTQRAMRSIPLKLPPLSEQEIIVDAIEEHFSRIDAAKVSLERCLQRCSLLRRAVLAAGFSGRLVTQDPNDEPASVLLERIAAELPKHRTRRRSA